MKHCIIACVLLLLTSISSVAQYNIPASGTQSITVCSGILYDNGGTSNYTDNSTGTITIHPATLGTYIQLDFTTFALDAGDYLEIWDGANTSATYISPYYTLSPGLLTASSPSGALTIRFVSSFSGNAEGIVAAINCSATPGLPDLTASTQTFNPSAGWALTTGKIAGSFTTRNFNAISSIASKTGYYFSTDNVLDGADIFLGSTNASVLGPFASVVQSFQFNVPPSTPLGDYFIIFYADYLQEVTETIETNNIKVSPFKIVPAIADLVIPPPYINRPLLSAGSTITPNIEIRNQGYAAVPASLVKVYVSDNTTYEASDVEVGSLTTAAIGITSSDYKPLSLSLPTTLSSGNYFLLFVADVTNVVTEMNETNNMTTVPITVTTDLLIPVSGSSTFTTCNGVVADAGGVNNPYPTTNGIVTLNPAVAGQSISLSFTSFNTDGCCDYLHVYDGTSTSAALIDSYKGSALPSRIVASNASGALTLRFVGGSNVNGASGFAASLSCTNVMTDPDLMVQSPSMSALSVPPNSSLTVSCTIRNLGSAAASPANVGYYLSTDTIFDASDVLVGSSPAATLGGNARTSRSAIVNIPNATTPGNYFLLFVADDSNLLAEASEANNYMNYPLTILEKTIDLAYTQGQSQIFITIGKSAYYSLTVRNSGNSPAPASKVGYYLSSDNQFDASDLLLATSSVYALPAGSIGSTNAMVKIPDNTVPGDYFLIFYVDYDQAITEINELNNITPITPVMLSHDITVPYSGTRHDTLCSGQITDAFGSRSNYHASSSGTLIIHPSTPGSFVKLEMTSLALGFGAYVTIYDGSTEGPASVIATYDRNSPLSSVTASNASGILSVRFSSTSSQSELAAGFTANASCSSTPAPADLTVLTPTVAPVNVPIGNRVTCSSTIKNQSVFAPVSRVGYYLSSDNTLDVSDVLLGFSADVAFNGTLNNVAVSTANIQIPLNTLPGSYFILFAADYENTVTETSETNNVGSKAITIVPLNTDLTTSYNYVSHYLYDGYTGDMSFYLDNLGTIAAAPSTLNCYLSTDMTYDAADVLIGSESCVGVAGGDSRSHSFPVSIPAETVRGTYYVLFYADFGNVVYETNETNNIVAVQVTIYDDIRMPINGTKSVTTCRGTLTDPSGSHDYSYTSSNNGTVTIYPGTPGQYVRLTFTVYDVDSGDYLEIFDGTSTSARRLDFYDSYSKVYGTYNTLGRRSVTTATNSSGALTVRFRGAYGSTLRIGWAATISCTPLPAIPDLTVQSITSTKSVIPSSYSLPFTTVVKNIGDDDVLVPSSLKYFLSTDTIYDAADVFLKEETVSSLTRTNTVTFNSNILIPANTPEGDYYVLAYTDHGQVVLEDSENNNTKAIALTVQDPLADFEVAMLKLYWNEPIPTAALTHIEFNFKNNGNINSAATFEFFLSTDAVYDASDFKIDSLFYSEFYAHYEIPAEGFIKALPTSTIPGNYYMLAVADAQNLVVEKDESNNMRAIPVTVLRDIVLGGGSGYDLRACDATITDGGDGNNGENSNNGYRTIYPGNGFGHYVNLVFTSFATDACCDSLVIYDGKDNRDPKLGVYSGNQSPGTVRASNQLGALTLEFYSDGITMSPQTTGFFAEISCADTPGNPQLAVQQPSIPQPQATAGTSMTAQVVVSNNGDVNSTKSRVVYYLSATDQASPSDIILSDETISTLNPTEQITVNSTLVIPSNVPSGQYYLVCVVYYGNNLEEANNNANYKALPLAITNVTGLNDGLENNFFKIYPNPSKGKITIESKNTGSHSPLHVTLTDAFGKIVEDKLIDLADGATQEIDVSSLNAGLYIVQLAQDEYRLLSQKLVINK